MTLHLAGVAASAMYGIPPSRVQRLALENDRCGLLAVYQALRQGAKVWQVPHSPAGRGCTSGLRKTLPRDHMRAP